MGVESVASTSRRGSTGSATTGAVTRTVGSNRLTAKRFGPSALVPDRDGTGWSAGDSLPTCLASAAAAAPSLAACRCRHLLRRPGRDRDDDCEDDRRIARRPCRSARPVPGFTPRFGPVPEGSRLVPVEFGACPVSGSADPDDVAPPELGPESVSAPATAAPASIAADIPAVITPAPNHTDNRSTLAPIHDYVFLSPQHHRRLAVVRARNLANGRRSNRPTLTPGVLGSRSRRRASPMTTHGAIVFPVVTRGMIEPSAIRSRSMPYTFRSESTTDIASIPIVGGAGFMPVAGRCFPGDAHQLGSGRPRSEVMGGCATKPSQLTELAECQPVRGLAFASPVTAERRERAGAPASFVAVMASSHWSISVASGAGQWRGRLPDQRCHLERDGPQPVGLLIRSRGDRVHEQVTHDGIPHPVGTGLGRRTRPVVTASSSRRPGTRP